MKAELFAEQIKNLEIEALIGVPDSTLKQFCDYVNTDGKGVFTHYVPANEGAAVGIATGVYLSTGKPACIYMQNSGLGNIVNPLTSIAHEEVYAIPMLFLIGWRGEPGIHDEPQHKFMGRVTEPLLNDMEIVHDVIDNNTTEEELKMILSKAKEQLDKNRQYAIIVKMGSFEKREGSSYENGYSFLREEAICTILKEITPQDMVVSTTGKISREVYEQSDIIYGQHSQEFLTVGGMGHTAMIAFGMASSRNEKRVYCIDGDGAILMHMGSLAFIGKQKPENLVHICLNNEAHESVGGMPTGAAGQRYSEVAKACGYTDVFCVKTKEALKAVLEQIQSETGPIFIEVLVAISARENLGRPKETAVQNKQNFMKYNEVK